MVFWFVIVLLNTFRTTHFHLTLCSEGFVEQDPKLRRGFSNRYREEVELRSHGLSTTHASGSNFQYPRVKCGNSAVLNRLVALGNRL